MLIRLWILGIATAVVSTELSGDHVCEFEESYSVNETEFTWRNVTVRNYKWCMGFPPRCSFYTFKTIRIPQITEKLEKRTVKKCCPGYAESERLDKCLPCMKCYEGKCGIGGKCVCNPGFRGDDCSNACESMRWGKDCNYDCLCERGSCDPRTGRCDCPSGWFGTRCELLCLEGFYGKHCINRCNCGERDLCNPETGECLQKRTRQEHQSTRAIHYMTEDILNISRILDKHQSTPSLKKYHTFDMELNFTQPINSRTTERTIKKETTKYIKPTEKVQKKISYVTDKDESLESTTESSGEIARNEPNVPILNENGSLEKNDAENNNILASETNSNSKEDNLWNENTTKIENTSNSSENKNEFVIISNKTNEKSQTTETEKTKYVTEITREPKLLETQPDNTTPQNSENILTETTSSVIIESKESLNIPAVLKNTPSMDRHHNKQNPQIVEDDQLQNLDNLNVLTSRETSTSYATLTTTLKSITFFKEAILPITEPKTSTRGFEDDISNELSTADSPEIRKPLKEAFDSPRSKEGNYLRNEASGEFEYSTNEKNNLTTQMAILGIVSLILVLLMSVVILLHNYAQKRRKKDKSKKTEHHQNYPGGPRVSVYAHSIFHTPLPEPPTFENPIFAPPTENSADSRTFQTHVVCSLNFSGHQRPEDKEYTYDHPPSTGSYRAASIPEPPDINESVTTEPLYDEIPSNGRQNPSSTPPPSYKSSCIYMNTCGKTRF